MKNKLKKKCSICNSKDFSKRKNYYKKNHLMYCKICDFTFSEKIPTTEELENYYGKIYEAILDTDQEFYDTNFNRKSYSILLDKFFSTGFMFGGGLKFKDNKGKVVPIDNDYKIRKLFNSFLGQILKNLVNFFLSITNTGATLKGYYLKSHHN